MPTGALRSSDKHLLFQELYLCLGIAHSGVARAFPGGRAAHPEDKNEEENEESSRKNKKNYRKMGKD